jgi:hypothetical protein
MTERQILDPDLEAMLIEKARAEEMSIVNLFGGGAIEQIDVVLAEALGNINDINTPPKDARKVTIEIVLKPMDEDRNGCAVGFKVGKKLAGPKPIVGTATMGVGPGARGVAFETRQRKLPFKDNVTQIRKESE